MMSNQYYNDTTTRHNETKIKRTGEHILTWIGVAIQALVAIMFLMIKPFIGNANFKEQIINETQKQGNQVSMTEVHNGVDALSGLFNFFTWGALIPLIIAIIGGILINKKPKLAGILLIIAGILAIATNWISLILWLIAGIMLLVRKPKKDMYGNGYYHDQYNDHHRRNNHDVNADNNAFILNEEEERNQQRYIKDHYSNKDQVANNNERHRDTHVNGSNDDYESGYRENRRNDYPDNDHRRYSNSNNDNDYDLNDRNNYHEDETRDYRRDNHREDLHDSKHQDTDWNNEELDRNRRHDNNDENHSIGMNQNLRRKNKQSNDFIQDEARKYQEEKDNDPYKY